MNSKISWHSIEREHLPHSLLNHKGAQAYLLDCLQENIHKNKISLAYNTEEKSFAQPPSIVVLAGESAPDVFSWLKVYTPEIFPLSQITRIISLSDWHLIQVQDQLNLSYYKATNDQWACLTLGEMLAQGDSETEIFSIPLSRANACFTSTIAKTAVIYQNPELLKACTERLIKLEQETRFVNRLVTVETLIPIWDQLELSCAGTDSITDILSHLHTNYSTKTGSIRKYLLPKLDSYQRLYSDSIEERVITFNEIIKIIGKPSSITALNIYTSAFLAAAAFLVGRGTTHLFLLRKLSKEYPSVFVWFGLFAANAGPDYWDPDWIRATKSISRSLRQKLDWSNPIQVDLCWAEFSWISSNIERDSIFSDIPKQYPKVLSIEIFPGASCQLRLANTAQPANEKRFVEQPTINPLSHELQKTLADLARLAIKANVIFENDLSTQGTTFKLDGNPPKNNDSYSKGTRLQKKLEDNDKS